MNVAISKEAQYVIIDNFLLLKEYIFYTFI